MKYFKLYFLLIAVLFSASSVYASANKAVANEKGQKIKETAEFQGVIDEYKAYASKVKPEIRDEIIEYRKEVAKLNKSKRLLYRKLSQDAQEHLKKEQEFKKRLPRNKSDLLAPEIESDKDAK